MHFTLSARAFGVIWLGTSELDRLAEVNWAHVKEGAGLPHKGWKLKRLSRRDDPRISSVTQLAVHRDAGRFTYKFQLRPERPERFAKHFRMQQEAYETFPHSDEFTMPETVYLDETLQVSLLRFLDGQPMSDAIKACRSVDAQHDLLARCGAWLDMFHRSSHDKRPFRPSHTLKYYEGLRAQIESDEIQVAAPKLYLRGIDRLREIAPDFAGRETVGARQHGDFHLRNLIWNAGQVGGIDVSKDGVTPIGYDVAKILLDFTTVFRESADLPAGAIVHPETAAAFFSGYKLVTADDPSVQYLLHSRILATLNTVQAAARERTEAKQRTLERLRPIARNAFRKGAGGANPAVLFFLTKRSLEAARAGEHEMGEAVKRALAPHGLRVGFRRNSAHQRDKVGAQDLTLVHMSEPVNAKGLVFRQAYAGPFWHIEQRAGRWDWHIARKAFDVASVDAAAAGAFFETWQGRLVPKAGRGVADEGFIYMPLQGKLLDRRRFQRASPIHMIEQTLAHSDLPVRATLHPNETYSEAELEALERIGQKDARFELVQLPMHEALLNCRYVVTENSSAAFHAILYTKPSVLFAGIDFQHIGFAAGGRTTAQSFREVVDVPVPFAKYLYWYWALNCLNFEAEDRDAQLVARLEALGWTIGA